MAKKMRTRKGNDGYDYPYSSTDLILDSTGKSATTKFNEIDSQVENATKGISTHNASTTSHNDIRLLITNLTNKLNTLADSDDTTLDQLSEIVKYIKNNKKLIDSVTTDKVNVSDIINNLTTNITNKPLSAAQGVALKSLIDAITVPTKVSQLTNDKNYLISIPDEYVTEDELNTKGYLTQHQDISGKVDKVAGKGLSTNDYTDAEKNTVKTLKENEINLIKDDLSTTGISDTKHDTLQTTDKTIIGAINEVFQSASNGKKLIADAITGKGVTTSNTDSFQTMATNIGNIQTGIDSPLKTWNQLPTLVKNYLENVTYDPSDYSVSHIAEYAPDNGDKNNTIPTGINIQTQEGVLNRNGYTLNVSNGNTLIYNDIPNEYTPYTISKDGKVIQTGTIKPTGALRQIKSTTQNVRDLGGWKCDGGYIKYGMLYRGGYINPADSDIFLNQMGVRHEMDLRGQEESKNATTSVLGNSIGYTCTKSYTWYSLANEEDWKTTLRCIFDNMTRNNPVYFHCSAGADRTGTVACILEAILGVSQSDIDKDYELTCFASGTATDNQARRRNETDWTGLINQIKNQPYEGSFRDKAIYWVLTLGFTLEEINNFRHNVINGSPEEVTVDIGSYAITNNLNEHINTSNTSTEILKFRSYSTDITVDNGYVMTDVKVLMGGSNITSSVFTGEQTVLFYKVTTNLQYCSLDIVSTRVVEGKRFEANVIPDTDYTLTDATVEITMGGVDMSVYYSNGKISIPKVTGDIVINITAVKSENIEIFDITEATAYHNTTGGSFVETTVDYASIDSDGVFTSKGARNTYGIIAFSNETLATLPPGDYIFKGEFKQSVSGASALAIYNGGSTNRIIKNSLQVGDTWTPFEYEFSLTEPDVTSHIYFSGQQDGDGIGYLRNVQFILKHKTDTSEENKLVTPVTWNTDTGCSYTVGQNFAQTATSGYVCSNIIQLNKDYNTCIMAFSDVTAPTSLKVVGANSSGIITEVLGFNNSILAGSGEYPLEFTEATTTQFVIRGYMETSIPNSTCKIIQKEV